MKLSHAEARPALDVVEELLGALRTCVSTYPETVLPTETDLENLIDGTAFFPGGAGLWRGEAPHGPLPLFFPTAPVMVIGHNFDSDKAYRQSRVRGGERQFPFWTTLKAMLELGGVKLEDCFLTNALMGVRAGGATGPMPRCPEYRLGCRMLLARQIGIVAPRVLITLGRHSEEELHHATETFPEIARLRAANVKHPSSIIYIKEEQRRAWIEAEGEKIRELVFGSRKPF